MSNMNIGSTTQCAPAFEVDNKEFNQQKKSLKGITPPKGESLEHAMFSIKLDNVVSPDIYAVSVKSVVKGVQDVTKVRKLTGMGEGAGGG